MQNYLLIGLIAFVCESIDSSLGMGYGTLLTPILLFMGFEALEVVPLILLSEFLTGILSAYMHHKKGNVNLKLGSKGLKVSLILALCSIFGTFAATYLALSVSKLLVKGYIAFLLLIIGVTNYLTINNSYHFSWPKIFILGTIASFNKGISGGGYGPLVTGGQILSGLDSKNAVGITSLSEGLTCLVGIISYFLLTPNNFNWYLGAALTIGALLSIPISVNIVKMIKEIHFKKILSVAILILGLFTFFNSFDYLLNYKNIPLILATILITIPFAYQLGKKQLISSSNMFNDITKNPN